MAHRRKMKDGIKERRTGDRVARLIRQRKALRHALAAEPSLHPMVPHHEGPVEPSTAPTPEDPLSWIDNKVLDKIIFAVERA